MPRRARHLIPTQLPRRGEVVAAFAVLVLLAHLLFAQLTFVLAVVFAAVSKTSRWRLWWLAVPAAAGLGWTLAIGPRAAAAGLAAGPAQILAYLGGGHPLNRLLHPRGAFAGVGGWLPRQFPLALIAAAAEAALVGWLDWVHTDEWAVRPPRPGALAAVRGALARRTTSAGVVVTRDGCVLGVAPGSGARVVLGWPEIAGGVLVTGADARTLAVSSLQVAHAALRRRKPLIVLDLTRDGGLAGVLGAACAATGTPLWEAVEAEDGRWLGPAPDETLLARVVRERSAALLSLRTQDVAAQVCAGILALGVDVRRIGADGDGLVWLYGYEPAPGGPLAGLAGSLVAGGAAAACRCSSRPRRREPSRTWPAWSASSSCTGSPTRPRRTSWRHAPAPNWFRPAGPPGSGPQPCRRQRPWARPGRSSPQRPSSQAWPSCLTGSCSPAGSCTCRGPADGRGLGSGRAPPARRGHAPRRSHVACCGRPAWRGHAACRRDAGRQRPLRCRQPGSFPPRQCRPGPCCPSGRLSSCSRFIRRGTGW